MTTIKKGQWVRVKNGIHCPDDPQFDLSGWQGKVVELDEDENGELLIGIEWDSVTLRQIPEEYIKRSEEECLNWTSIFLGAHEVEPTRPRASREDADKTRRHLQGLFEWLGHDRESDRIKEIIDSAASFDDWELLLTWNRHLLQNLRFPFEAVIDEHQPGGVMKKGDRVKVFQIRCIDDRYGIVVACCQNGIRCDFPLSELVCADAGSPNHQPVSDYRLWFAHR